MYNGATMSEPFRNEGHAALERVAQLEAENAELQRRLAEYPLPPPTDSALPGWMLALFVTVPVLLLVIGGAVAFFVQRSPITQ